MPDKQNLKFSDYALLDSGNFRRLEQFSGILVDRPAPAANWLPGLDKTVWNQAGLYFTHETGWQGQAPHCWSLAVGETALQLKLSAKGQIGIFPEHLDSLNLLYQHLAVNLNHKPCRILNLFAYTGLATLVLSARVRQAEITHVDAAKSALSWARDNAQTAGLADCPIRWLIDDAAKFVNKENRRGQRYDAVILDPPTFGRDSSGKIWKLEKDLPALLEEISQALNPQGLLALSCHPAGWEPGKLKNLLLRYFNKELVFLVNKTLELQAEPPGKSLPCGLLAIARVKQL